MKRVLCWACLFLSSSCLTATLDLRDLEEPVILNGNPFLGGEPEGRVASQVAEYKGQVGESSVASGYSSSRTVANDAQAAAFEQIGGSKNRAITGLSIEVTGWGMNALFALGEVVAISAKGKVMEYER